MHRKALREKSSQKVAVAQLKRSQLAVRTFMLSQLGFIMRVYDFQEENMKFLDRLVSTQSQYRRENWKKDWEKRKQHLRLRERTNTRTRRQLKKIEMKKKRRKSLTRQKSQREEPSPTLARTAAGDQDYYQGEYSSGDGLSVKEQLASNSLHDDEATTALAQSLSESLFFERMNAERNSLHCESSLPNLSRKESACHRGLPVRFVGTDDDSAPISANTSVARTLGNSPETGKRRKGGKRRSKTHRSRPAPSPISCSIPHRGRPMEAPPKYLANLIRDASRKAASH